MRSDYTIQKELQELNSNVLLPKADIGYSVPEGYFDTLPALILAKVKAGEQEAINEIETLSPLLAGLSRKMPFDVPEGYFDNLEAQPDTHENISLAWKEARFNPTYSVPEGYFDQLPEQILAKVAPKHTGRVVSMGQRLMRYATAACLTGLVAMAGYLYFGKPGVVTPQAQPHQWVAAKLQNTSNQELDAFMQTADAGHITAKAQAPAAKTEVKKLLKNVSNEELEEFLDQVPVSDEESFDMN